MRLNFDARCLYPLSITLRATDFETILRGNFCETNISDPTTDH